MRGFFFLCFFLCFFLWGQQFGITEDQNKKDSLNELNERKQKPEEKPSNEKFKTPLDAIFYLPVYSQDRFLDIDTSLRDFFRQYDKIQRYDLISKGGLNLGSREFSLIKQSPFGFDTPLKRQGFWQEIPLIQTYRPISRFLFTHDPFYSSTSRNTNQVNFTHFQPIGRRVSAVILWNTLGTSGFLDNAKEELHQFGGKLYYRNLSGTFWSINDYYYQSTNEGISGGLRDSVTNNIIAIMQEQQAYLAALGNEVLFNNLNYKQLFQKVQSDHYWIFSKRDSITFFDPSNRSYLRYKLTYFNGQAFLNGLNTGSQNTGFEIFGDKNQKYIADLKKTEHWEHELQFQMAGRIFTPVVFSRFQASLVHQSGYYKTGFFEGAFLNSDRTNFYNIFTKIGLKTYLGPFFLENKTHYGFLGYHQNALQMRNTAGLEFPDQQLYLSYIFENQPTAIDHSVQKSQFLNYKEEKKNERFFQYQIQYHTRYQNKLTDHDFWLQLDYLFYKNYFLIDAQGAPFSLKNFSYVQGKIKYRIFLWKFGIEQHFTYFFKDKGAFELPIFSYRGAFYYKNIFLKGALGFQTGFDFTYYPSYKPWIYHPFRQDFSPFSENTTLQSGNYPFLDIYVAFRMGKTRLMLKYTNAFFGYNKTFDRFNNKQDFGYFGARGYIFNESIIKFSIDWLLEY